MGYDFTILEPNGRSANLAILKNCNPKGIPTMVIQHRHPSIRLPRASSIPDTIIQIILRNSDPTPPSYTISLPKGQREIFENLKHCTPTGIPIMVMHQNIPASHQPIALNNPPKIIQTIFPNNFIYNTSLFYYF